MPEYVSAEALLADVDLRLNRLPPGRGALIVEGPDDKRLFHPLVVSSAQIIVTGGRRLLLAAHEQSGPDRDRVLFLTDCDYEVGMGRLRPAESLIITQHADVEADLLELLIERLVAEYVPAALRSDSLLRQTSETVLRRAREFAEIMGQARRVALSHSIEVDFSRLKLKDSRKRRSAELDPERLATKIAQSLEKDCDLSVLDLVTAILAMPTGYMYCNGKDLLLAVSFVLREDFKVTVDTDTLASSLRLCAREALERWRVINRIRAWQLRNGREILAG